MEKGERYVIVIVLLALLLIGAVWFFYDRRLSALEHTISKPP